MATSPNQTAAGGQLATRLAGVEVGLRRDLVVTRQVVHDGARYVVHDPVTFGSTQFTVTEYRILGALAAQRTLAHTFAALQAEGVLQPEDQDEFYAFVVRLHGMGLLHLPGFPVEVHYRRQQARRRARPRLGLRSLLSLRVSLGDPDRVLARMLPAVGWLFARPGLLLWLLLMSLAAWQCVGRLPELYYGLGDLLALANLPALWISLVLLKALHETGHGIAIKHYGGTVPDCGLLFVMFTPCAYVDANASWTFANRWHRVVVALAGVYVESFVAASAVLVWAGSQPGLLHDVARNIVVLASVTTVLVNINPLVRYDGYYLLSDLLGLVNLQSRALRFLRGALEHRLLGLPRGEHEDSRRNRWVYAIYAPMTVVYRGGVAFGITALMLLRWPTAGVVLGVLFGGMLIVAPVCRLLLYLWRGERTAPVRLRARCAAVTAVMVTVAAFALLPVSVSVVAPGVLDPGIRRSVRAPGSGFVDEVLVPDGQHVAAGAPVCRLHSHLMEEELQGIEAEIGALEVRRDVEELSDTTLAAAHAARLEFLRERAGELRTRVAALSLTAPVDGTVVDSHRVVPGQFVRQGDQVLQVHSNHTFVRVVLTDLEVARADLEIGSDVELRWTCDPDQTVHAVVREIYRSASRHQVPVELTMAAGGRIYARATGAQTEADQPYLHVFLAADSVPVDGSGAGLTAAVRFKARVETLGDWAQRRLLNFLNNWRMS
jgi:putative peptide zinc metalloprotease protein